MVRRAALTRDTTGSNPVAPDSYRYITEKEINMAEIVEHIVRLTIDGDETKAEAICTLTRCGDCKHLSSDRIAPDWNRICRKYGVGKPDDGFCDEGERKEKNERIYQD